MYNIPIVGGQSVEITENNLSKNIANSTCLHL